jgi:hypothetical protein
MSTRKKLEIPINEPVIIELLFDEPITGSSKYGPYFMYAVKIEEEEYSFFPTVDVHEKLKELKKGDKARILKLAAQRGSKLVTTFDVQVENNKTMGPNPIDNIEGYNPLDQEINDNYRFLLLQSYKDALEVQRELNGLCDIDRAALSLFIARTKC